MICIIVAFVRDGLSINAAVDTCVQKKGMLHGSVSIDVVILIFVSTDAEYDDLSYLDVLSFISQSPAQSQRPLGGSSEGGFSTVLNRYLTSSSGVTWASRLNGGMVPNPGEDAI